MLRVLVRYHGGPGIAREHTLKSALAASTRVSKFLTHSYPAADPDGTTVALLEIGRLTTPLFTKASHSCPDSFAFADCRVAALADNLPAEVLAIP